MSSKNGKKAGAIRQQAAVLTITSSFTDIYQIFDYCQLPIAYCL